MLDKLRDRVTQTLAETNWCALATAGPAGLQASMVRCAGRGASLYLLLPDTSDHLFNLETEPEVAVTTETWQLHGTAEIIRDGTDMFLAEQNPWYTVIEVTPTRLHILPVEGRAMNYAETIDFVG